MFKAYDYFSKQLLASSTDKKTLIDDCLKMGCCHDVVIVSPDKTASWLTQSLDR